MRKVEIELEYQPYIAQPPYSPVNLHAQACSNDGPTIESWREIWIKNVQENQQRFGPFKDHSIGSFFRGNHLKPCIVAGAGPSLKYNVQELRNKGDICLVSCLHNFHFMEDNGVDVDFYVTLDAGEVTIEEVSEGGSKTAEEYWELTRERTLLAFIGSSPKLIEKWRGPVYFFNAPVPDDKYMTAVEAIEVFSIFIGTGGNVLGACLYIAKGILGSSSIAFIGADFSFSYDKKFHGWKSKYDATLGQVVKATDVFGNKVYTWQSYANFKAWFEWVAMTVPGVYFNCTEGGIFGAYPEGNILAVKQLELKTFIDMMNMSDQLKAQCENPETRERLLLF